MCPRKLLCSFTAALCSSSVPSKDEDDAANAASPLPLTAAAATASGASALILATSRRAL